MSTHECDRANVANWQAMLKSEGCLEHNHVVITVLVGFTLNSTKRNRQRQWRERCLVTPSLCGPSDSVNYGYRLTEQTMEWAILAFSTKRGEMGWENEMK